MLMMAGWLTLMLVAVAFVRASETIIGEVFNGLISVYQEFVEGIRTFFRAQPADESVKAGRKKSPVPRC